MNEFLAGVGILAVGGLATAAIKYPRGYARLAWPLFILALLVAFGTVIYFAGFTHGSTALYPLLDGRRLNEAIEIGDRIERDTLWWMIGSFALAGFLGLFALMPKILEISDKTDEQGDGKNEG